jgi:DNA-binding transcriptional regulator PaaX
MEEKRFYTLLAKLRKEGIIKKQGIGASAVCNLTNNGLEKLLNYAEQTHSLNLPIKKYVSKKINTQTLVTFDIPENLKQYRNWIRYQLVALGFSMLQKSVWVGTYQIPPDFLHDLRELNLLQYIHIFKVTKSGSID